MHGSIGLVRDRNDLKNRLHRHGKLSSGYDYDFSSWGWWSNGTNKTALIPDEYMLHAKALATSARTTSIATTTTESAASLPKTTTRPCCMFKH
jgi:hypothetical protein